LDPFAFAFKAKLTVMYDTRLAAEQFAQEIGNVLGGEVQLQDVTPPVNGRRGVRAVMKLPDPKVKLLLPQNKKAGTMGNSSSSSSSAPFVIWEYSSSPTRNLTVHLQTYDQQQGGSLLARDVFLWLLVVLFPKVSANSHLKKFKENTPWGKLKAAAEAAAAEAAAAGGSG
jgi:hypothetical protein